MTERDDASPACRLYAILARDGRSGVVFRRGPSRQVRLLRWWLDSDTVEPGQWLKGRIYERRCDVSPDGSMLVYFAAKWETPLATWTAISRPPYLTALALWPKGDAWGGGGLFLGPRTLGLNHFESSPVQTGKRRQAWHPLGDEGVPLPRLPRGLAVKPVAAWAGRGEDSPIEDTRMSRDGWQLVAPGTRGSSSRGDEFAFRFEQPEVYERPSPRTGANPLVLRRLLTAIGQRNGPWRVESFQICRPDGTGVRDVADCGWADWDQTGDLLFALGGCLYRLPAVRAPETVTCPIDGARLVADLTSMRFEGISAPPSASMWPETIGR